LGAAVPDTKGNDTSGKESAGKSFQITPPAITLSKGGGAIRGIGEKFAANPVIGTGSMSVPIATSPGRSGFGPQLSLSYDSGAGNSPFGIGWLLSLPQITRNTGKGLPQHNAINESDVFTLSGAAYSTLNASYVSFAEIHEPCDRCYKASRREILQPAAVLHFLPCKGSEVISIIDERLGAKPRSSDGATRDR
jgi:hypothetical protein